MLATLAKGVALLTIPLVALIGILGQPILGLFGEGYEAAYLPLLLRASEVEAADVGAGAHLAPPQLDLVTAAGDRLPHRLLGVQQVAALVDVGELDAVAHA